MSLVPLRPLMEASMKYGFGQGADLANGFMGGYTSVIIDGSSLPFKENIELTREVVRYAHARGVSVEGELGVLVGVEDHVFSASSTYTNHLIGLF